VGARHRRRPDGERRSAAHQPQEGEVDLALHHHPDHTVVDHHAEVRPAGGGLPGEGFPGPGHRQCRLEGHGAVASVAVDVDPTGSREGGGIGGRTPRPLGRHGTAEVERQRPEREHRDAEAKDPQGDRAAFAHGTAA